MIMKVVLHSKNHIKPLPSFKNMLTKEEIRIFEVWQFYDKHGYFPFEKGETIIS